MAPALLSPSLTPRRILSPAPFNSSIMLPDPKPLVPYCPGQAFCICMKIRQVRTLPLLPLVFLFYFLKSQLCLAPCFLVLPSSPPGTCLFVSLPTLTLLLPTDLHSLLSSGFPPSTPPRKSQSTFSQSLIELLTSFQNYSSKFVQSCSIGRAVDPSGESIVVC